MAELEPSEIKLELPEPTEAQAKGWPATTIVSIAAVIVTALVGILGIVNTRTSQFYEEEKNERDFRLNCVTSAAVIAQMAFSLSKDFKQMPDDEKINQINIIIASFPPDTANRFLSALAPRMGTAQSVITAFQVAQQNSTAQVEAEKRTACPSAQQLIGVSETTAEPTPAAPALPAVAAAAAPSSGPGAGVTAAPVPAAPAAAPPPTPPGHGGGGVAGPVTAPPAAPPPPTAAPAATPRKITVYYQITQREDANYAKMIARDVAAAPPGTDSNAVFASGGVELVPQVGLLADTEIRYYRLDQDTAASDLKGQLLEEAKAESLKLSVTTRYIGDRYPNLPAGRMEVWFQPLAKAHQG